MPRMSSRRRARMRRGKRYFKTSSLGTGGMTWLTRKAPPQGIYNFKRTYFTTLTYTYNGTLTESHGSFIFKLSDLQNNSEFTSLFDQYRIKAIKAQFIPRFNSQGAADTSGTWTHVPPILTVIDYDDGDSGQDNSSLVQYQNCKCHYEYKPFTLFFRPRAAMAGYGGGAFTSYGQAKLNQWFDCSNSNVEYYALKWASLGYSASNNGDAPSWDVIFTYYLQFRYPR